MQIYIHMYFYTVARHESQRFYKFLWRVLFERIGCELARGAVV